jgi:hypothetical protein
MKLIYHGTPPEERKYSGTCFNCGTMYDDAIEKELRYDPPPPVSTQGNEGRYYGTCEVCSKTIYFNRMMP